MIPFAYQVIRRPRRKTASITIKPDCTVQVRVPAALPEHIITEFVNNKSKLIQSKLNYFKELQRTRVTHQYTSGEVFAYLGKDYRLELISGTVGVKLKKGKFIVSLPEDLPQDLHAQRVKEQLVHWYHKHAETKLIEKTRHYSLQLGVPPVSVEVKEYKSRWGCCYSDGRIRYNWKLIIAPHPIIDMVVTHELCHLIHPNHSTRFWQLLGTIIPDYQEKREWLKTHGHCLTI